MKFVFWNTGVFVLLWVAVSGGSKQAYAWGRHDLITRIALQSPEFASLKFKPVRPESIDHAAPDLLKRVIPDLEAWSERFHTQFDTRYPWKPPASRPGLSPKQSLLWALEDNIETPLRIGKEKSAAEILIRYSEEPDGELDEGLDRPPYIERMRSSMSLFETNDVHTHAFRHYYVPSSWLPPILEPKGIAPYRAALYAELSRGAFKTGHPYWGYRFLAWSLHYVQDVTQPWHTVFLPNLSFLTLSKSGMKHEIQALHYLTEAFADSWMLHVPAIQEPTRTLASDPRTDPWYVARLSEKLAIAAHLDASNMADLARKFFEPVVDRLGPDLKLHASAFSWGSLPFTPEKLDFSNDGVGATAFLAPIWDAGFKNSEDRDRLTRIIADRNRAAIEVSRRLLASLNN